MSPIQRSTEKNGLRYIKQENMNSRNFYLCQKCDREVGTVYDSRLYDRDVELCTDCATKKGIV